jgi:nitrogen fixation NifU-like protein
MNNLDFLYEENILEHYRNPKNKVERDFEVCETCGIGENVDCGDRAEIFLDIDNGKIKNVTWTGTGCAISQAAMSMMTEKIKNDRIGLQDLKLWSPSVIYELLGVKISPSRVNCALLSYKCLENALKNIDNKN